MNSNIIKCCILLCLLLVQASCSGNREKKEHVSEVTNPLPIKLGDPFILHASDGKYYMYGTSLPDGFEAYVSTDLSQWTACGQVYKGGGEEQWNVDCFWAPEVYERNGKYYMFYSANSRNNPTNEGENFKLGVAVSLSPVGPFTDLYNRPIFEVDYPVIDANVYFDDANGKTYLYYSRCCYKHPVESEIAEQMKREGVYDEIEESWVYGVEMKPDFSGIVGELLVQGTAAYTNPDNVCRVFENNDGIQFIAYNATAVGNETMSSGYARNPLFLTPCELNEEGWFAQVVTPVADWTAPKFK